MADGNTLLNLKIDIDRWRNMGERERIEHTFWCLSYLTEEAQKNKFRDKLLTFAGSFAASLATLIPTIWVILSIINTK